MEGLVARMGDCALKERAGPQVLTTPLLRSVLAKDRKCVLLMSATPSIQTCDSAGRAPVGPAEWELSPNTVPPFREATYMS